MTYLTDAEWTNKQTKLKGDITRARAAVKKCGTLDEKLKAVEVRDQALEALRQHRLNYHELTRGPATYTGPDEFYVQDSRSIVGNDLMWWGIEGIGYTSDVSKARVFTMAQAVAQHQTRDTDIPWPKAYIDARTRPVVDHQYINRDEALAGTGIAICPPEPFRKEQNKCCGCGCFISDAQLYSSGCPRCGTDNRP